MIQIKKLTPVCLGALALVCFALSPTAQAQLSPPPDGGYPNRNTAEGDDALFSLTFGVNNTANGFEALFSNATASNNTAVGTQALFRNTIGDENTAIGVGALFSNTLGDDNTATGVSALFGNTFGSLNTATGVGALGLNTSGSNNTANGWGALSENMTGGRNTANGVKVLRSNTSGSNNTAEGTDALFSNTIGGNNIALGQAAGRNLTVGDNNIDIGNRGVAGESDTIRIGSVQTRTFVAGISGVAVTGSPVVVNANGRLGVTASSARFKEAIKPMDKASEAILALKPVTFHYKKAVDPDGIPQFGLVAEQVEKVNPDLIARDADGKPYTVRYDAVNAMLLNEFLKEHRKVEQLEKQVEALTAGLQKVSAQLELSKPAPQTALNNP
jgi:hypothetical protein